MRGQLETAEEEKTSLQALLEQMAQEGKKSKELLAKKNMEVHLLQQETQQVLVNLCVILWRNS